MLHVCCLLLPAICCGPGASQQLPSLVQINGKPLYVAIAQKKQDRQRRLKNYFQQPQAGAFMGPQGMNPGYYGGEPPVHAQPGCACNMPGSALQRQLAPTSGLSGGELTHRTTRGWAAGLQKPLELAPAECVARFAALPGTSSRPSLPGLGRGRQRLPPVHSGHTDHAGSTAWAAACWCHGTGRLAWCACLQSASARHACWVLSGVCLLASWPQVLNNAWRPLVCSCHRHMACGADLAASPPELQHRSTWFQQACRSS